MTDKYLKQIKDKVSSITNPHLYSWSFQDFDNNEFLTVNKYENLDGYGLFISVYVKPQHR